MNYGLKSMLIDIVFEFLKLIKEMPENAISRFMNKKILLHKL